MTLSTTQDIFDLTLARPAAESDARRGSVQGLPGLGGLIHLWWLAPEQGDRLAQVYVDGELNTVTCDPAQRELWLVCDPSQPHQIELLAVPADDAENIWRSRPELLQGCQSPLRRHASLTLLRDERLPVDTMVAVRVDGDEVARTALWPASEHRGGFGALFGLGEFGRDALTGPGLGSPDSQLGMGPLGADGTAWRWTSDVLSAGTHTITAQALDPGGQVVAELTEPINLTIDAVPVEARKMTVSPDFRLSWSQ
jgi:hypothetical protein